MQAIMYEGARFCGVYPNYDETVELLFDFVLVEELPEALVSIPEGHYPAIQSVDPLVITHEPFPTPEPTPQTPEQIKISQLETQLETQAAAIDFLLMNSMGGM